MELPAVRKLVSPEDPLCGTTAELNPISTKDSLAVLTGKQR
jgi:hypothetical protein